MHRRSGLIALAAVGALALLLALRPGWLTSLGIDIGDLPQHLATLHEEGQRRERLDHASAEMKERMRLKREAVWQLAAGRRTLVNTATLFVQLAEHNRDWWPNVRRTEEGATDTERLCRHVIGYTRVQLQAEDYPNVDEVIQRLERELADWVRSGGPTVQPPQAAPPPADPILLIPNIPCL